MPTFFFSEMQIVLSFSRYYLYTLSVNTRFEADKLQGLGFLASRGEILRFKWPWYVSSFLRGPLEPTVVLKNQDCAYDTLLKWKFAQVHGPNMLLLDFFLPWQENLSPWSRIYFRDELSDWISEDLCYAHAKCTLGKKSWRSSHLVFILGLNSDSSCQSHIICGLAYFSEDSWSDHISIAGSRYLFF